VGIDLGRDLNLMGSRQGETDYDQQREKSANSVDQFLHDQSIPFSVRRGGIIPQKGDIGHNARMTGQDNNSLPIGVFDSGVGGLTVLKAIREALPNENLIYLGDTARLPYGTKSPASIARYATQATAKLMEHEIKMLVVACNTASAVALEVLQEQMAPVPVIGVVEPGATAAVTARPGGAHLVLATEATVRLAAYSKAIAAQDPGAQVREQSCELLVALAEEGWTRGDIADSIVRRYLDAAANAAFVADSIILGCTHFPLLRDTISAAVGASVEVVDSAGTTAAVVREILSAKGELAEGNEPGTLQLLATDGITRFARVGGQFLGEPLTAENVHLVDL
jgi:glutamate racemase